MLFKTNLLSVESPLECRAMAAMSYFTTEMSVRIEDLSIFGDAGEAEGKLNKCHGGTAREMVTATSNSALRSHVRWHKSKLWGGAPLPNNGCFAEEL
jgi:hypothetical protein